ncbi:hypothetical protein BURKHO8Y_140261 [Burkholderia sp. 8Y]|nr:hypothetical protein BURKHO8Y_140261 [Burkholderia sp. 8Y]
MATFFSFLSPNDANIDVVRSWLESVEIQTELIVDVRYCAPTKLYRHAICLRTQKFPSSSRASTPPHHSLARSIVAWTNGRSLRSYSSMTVRTTLHLMSRGPSRSLTPA